MSRGRARDRLAEVFDEHAFIAAVNRHRNQPNRKHTLQETCDLSGVPQATLCDVLPGSRPPTLATAVRLAVYADLNLHSYFTVTENDL